MDFYVIPQGYRITTIVVGDQEFTDRVTEFQTDDP